MTFFDRALQRWRISMARPFIRPGARVLDIGGSDGTLFTGVGHCGAGSLSIDPDPDTNEANPGGFPLVRGFFPQDMPADAGLFDAVVMLAVLEHFPPDQYVSLGDGIARFLKPGGSLIITVPSPQVDRILPVLQALRLVHAATLDEHHGYDVKQTTRVFPEPKFTLTTHRSFQLGLNNLFVFSRSSVV